MTEFFGRKMNCCVVVTSR